MSQIKIVPVPGLILEGVVNLSATKFVASDHRLISGRPAIPAQPGVVPGPNTPGKAPTPEQPAVSGSVDSHVALLSESGQTLWSSRVKLSPADYAEWNETDATIDDDLFITQKHALALGLSLAE